MLVRYSKVHLEQSTVEGSAIEEGSGKCFSSQPSTSESRYSYGPGPPRYTTTPSTMMYNLSGQD